MGRKRNNICTMGDCWAADAWRRKRVRNTFGSTKCSLHRQRGRANTLQVILKLVRNNSVPNLTHDVKVSLQVVSGSEYRIQNLARLEQVPKVCSGVVSTSIALASGVDGLFVVAVTGMLDHHPALTCKKIAIAGISGWQHAIHHVDPARDVLGKLGRHPDPHGVPRL